MKRDKKRGRRKEVYELAYREKFLRVISIVLLILLGFTLSGGLLSLSETIHGRLPPYAMFTRGASVQSIVETIIFLIMNLTIVGALYWSWRSAARPGSDLSLSGVGVVIAILTIVVEVYVILHLKLGFI